MKKVSFIAILCGLVLAQTTWVFGANLNQKKSWIQATEATYNQIIGYSAGFEGTGLNSYMYMGT